ncbi:MAG: 2-C-methyl-D-erythritol 2,4-cyclodiphosphate synthase [Dehalococcoidales bacterium]|jgi:2-C-methyl-D-erythritol 2,4-cyclodiphosphate synthase|nr:2-C-methyl-D-erythritol 2,4-cyclodiphosphate synthase [Dehalococcoidales bacterium]|tara:strand:- start:233 stop:718 length:486 start_codon:yes stop_codon:yes gene_type:complete
MELKIRTGIGYDVHRLALGHSLVLGGVEIPSAQGLVGWSDADVLTHSIIDALLGAVVLGDIGRHFPPGDPQYKDISSLVLLEKVGNMLNERGWEVGNIDATIVAEKPILRDFLDGMRQNLSLTLGIDASQVSVKASTSEQLGFVGREEGMVAWAVATITRK